MKTFQRSRALGTDGLLEEFYLCFWNDTKTNWRPISFLNTDYKLETTQIVRYQNCISEGNITVHSEKHVSKGKLFWIETRKLLTATFNGQNLTIFSATDFEIKPTQSGLKSLK